MLGQRLADPDIFPVVGADQQDKVVTSGIIGMQEISDYA